MRRAGLAVLPLIFVGLLSKGAFANPLPIAVMDLTNRGVDEAAAAALTTEVSNTISSLRAFQVITREDIRKMLQLEQTKQQCTGGVDASCMAEIGGALGVDYLVYGDIAKIAGTYSLSLTLLNINKAKAQNRVNKKISEAGALLNETELAAKLLVQPLLADRRGFLVVDAKELGAQVKVDGRLVGVTPLAGRLELTMGAHEIEVEKKGFLVWAKTIDIAPNQAIVEPISMVPSETFIQDYKQSAALARIFAWSTAVLGAALLGTAGVLKLTADARFDDQLNKGYLTQQANVCAELNPNFSGSGFCPTQAGFDNDVLGTVSSIETMDSIALGSAITGAVSALISIVLFVTGDSPSRYDAYGASPSAGLAPVFVPTVGQGTQASAGLRAWW